MANTIQLQLPTMKVSIAAQKPLMGGLTEDNSVDSDSESEEKPLHRFVTENMDSRLRGVVDTMSVGPIDTAENVDAQDVESMTEGCIALWESQTSDEPTFLTAAPDQYIGYLSTINLVSVASDTLPHSLPTGNSRDPPTRFLFHCKTANCPRTFNTSLRRDQHQVNCAAQPSLPSLFDTVDSDDAVTPPVTFRSKRTRKKTDIDRVSEGFPKPCPDRDLCGVVKEFATDHLMKNHRTLHHDDNWPKDIACNVTDCQLPKDHYFVSREAFRRHLSSYHMLNAAQCNEYVGKIIPVKFVAPRGVSKNFMTTMCLFPNCKTDAEFANYSDYTGHLKKIHSQNPEQYPLYMPTLSTVRLHPRPQNIDTTTPVDREFVTGERCSHTDRSTAITVYTTNRGLDRHLGLAHQIAADDRAKHYPGVEIAPFYGTQCLHEDCAGKGRFYPTLSKYERHLRAQHDLSTIAEINPYQLWWKQKYT